MKIVLCGNSGAGKTSIVRRLVDGTYTDAIQAPQVGVRYETLQLSDETLHLWEVAGDPRYHHLMETYLKPPVTAVLFVFDVTARDSYDAIDVTWLPLTVGQTERPTLRYLVGAKIDTHPQRPRVVTDEEAIVYAVSRGMRYFEVSAKVNGNNEVRTNFEALVKLALLRQLEDTDSEHDFGDTSALFVEPLRRRRRCCYCVIL